MGDGREEAEMIGTRIRGGLGNQLFQYCAGRALALRHGVELCLDLRDFERKAAFRMGLSHFNIQTVPAGRLPIGREDGLAALGKVFRGGALKPYREASLGYDPAFDGLGDDRLLRGYWQSERYFSEFESQIRADLAFAEPAVGQNADVLAEISAENAVSLHIRRGDYVASDKVNAAHGTCDLAYYARAVEAVASRVEGPFVIYAFSDDPAWVTENLRLDQDVRFVDHNTGATAQEDMRLMSACRHHIIANSSFTWWGAWLNPRADKVVVGPKQWFADPKKNNPDILPEGWVRV